MLTENQIKAAELMSMGLGPSEIAKRLDVSRQIVYRWKGKEEFRMQVDKFVQDKKILADHRLSSKLNTYIDELEKIALTSRSDKTRSEALQYLIDRNLGKPTKKTENINQDASINNDKKQDAATWEDMAAAAGGLKLAK